MKRILVRVTTAIVALAFASSAFAYPNLTEKTGKPCTYCHKTATGGKDLTAAGQYYKKNGKLPPQAKPAAKPKPKPKPKPGAKPSQKAGAGKGPSAQQPPRDEAPLK